MTTIGFRPWNPNIACRNNSRNRMFVNHLTDRVFEQHHKLVKRFNLPLQLDTINQID